jgi:hypothetical protein
MKDMKIMKGRQFISRYQKSLKPGVKSFALMLFFQLTHEVNATKTSNPSCPSW